MTNRKPTDAQGGELHHATVSGRKSGSCEPIIDALGGTSKVARACGTSVSTVSTWKARNSIPAERWLALADLARRRGVNGITLETLAELHSRHAPPGGELTGTPAEEAAAALTVTAKDATEALTELARAARDAVALSHLLHTTAERVEDLIDRLASHAGCTVTDVYAPLFSSRQRRRADQRTTKTTKT
jgi:hypothetical protein